MCRFRVGSAIILWLCITISTWNWLKALHFWLRLSRYFVTCLVLFIHYFDGFSVNVEKQLCESQDVVQTALIVPLRSIHHLWTFPCLYKLESVGVINYICSKFTMMWISWGKVDWKESHCDSIFAYGKNSWKHVCVTIFHNNFGGP
jgi:hypothetical protein